MPRKRAKEARPIAVGKRRRCDNCPKLYTPRTKEHRFCNPTCRAEYHRFGPILERLGDQIDRKVEEIALYKTWRVYDQQMRSRFRQQEPELARQFEAREASEAA